MSSSPNLDILIAGAGVIGLALALELQGRGARVAVLETGSALGQASAAAAGMLAARDPHNPAELAPLSQLSIGLYPTFLQRLSFLSGVRVPFQTDTTVQYAPDGRRTSLAEHSIDPRQLASALASAFRMAARSDGALAEVALHEQLGALSFAEEPQGVVARAADGRTFQAPMLVHAAGARVSFATLAIPITPRKGQMLRVALPSSLPLREVHRNASVYVVPRRFGPQAGSALIGATLEDAGFDLSTHPADLDRLRAEASLLLPELADPEAAPQLESWAGIRPATPDLLPLLGRLPGPRAQPPGSTRQWIAAGHFRNGILLAPGTAQVMADLLEGKLPAVSVQAFSPLRFTAAFPIPAQGT